MATELNEDTGFVLSIKMTKELNEETAFKLSIKTLIGIGFAMATLISMYFMLQADIAEAKELPVIPPDEVTRMEFNMKEQMIRNTILDTQKDVQEIKSSIEKIEDKLYNRNVVCFTSRHCGSKRITSYPTR